MDLADVKPSVLTFITVGVLAVVFIVLFKFVAAKSNIQALQEFAGAI